MTDLISRQALLKELPHANWGKEWDEALAKAIIESMPTIDHVPVVRCKDCKWWREETDHTCRKWGGASPRNANGYCDDAERSEG